MVALRDLVSPSATDRPADDVVDSALDTVRRHLGMSVAFLSEFMDGRAVFRAVSAAGGEAPVRAGDSRPLSDMYCPHVVDGRLPQLIPDTAAEPIARALPITSALSIGSHVGVPIRREDGSVYGMFCCLGPAANPSLNARDLAVVRLFADLCAGQINRTLATSLRREASRASIRRILAEGDFDVVFQSIHDLASPRVVGFEALCRFHPQPYRPPNEWFAEAMEAGLDRDLEVAVAARALDALERLPPKVHLSVNASPDTIASGRLAPLLDRAPSRTILEITEHASIADFGALDAALADLRARGLRLAVDDAGAGYAGLHHILRLRPDIIKLDMSLTRDIDSDFARRALAAALQGFARQVGAVIVAEGIETPGELMALTRLGIMMGQGYLLGRPQGLSDVLESRRTRPPGDGGRSRGG